MKKYTVLFTTGASIEIDCRDMPKIEHEDGVATYIGHTDDFDKAFSAPVAGVGAISLVPKPEENKQ